MLWNLTIHNVPVTLFEHIHSSTSSNTVAFLANRRLAKRKDNSNSITFAVITKKHVRVVHTVN